MTINVNGACFFTELEGLLVQAHDRGLVNENALRDVLRELVEGEPLTVPMLMQVFGTDPMFHLLQKAGRHGGRLLSTAGRAGWNVPADDPDLPEAPRQSELGASAGDVPGPREPTDQGDREGLRGQRPALCNVSAREGDAVR